MHITQILKLLVPINSVVTLIIINLDLQIKETGLQLVIYYRQPTKHNTHKKLQIYYLHVS